MMELVDGKCHGTFHCANVDRIGCRTVTDKVTEEECDWLSQVVLSHNKRMSTILGLCTAKADFGRYLKLSVQLCVTATQLSQNRDLLRQLPHRNSTEQAGERRALDLARSVAVLHQRDCDVGDSGVCRDCEPAACDVNFPLPQQWHERLHLTQLGC